MKSLLDIINEDFFKGDKVPANKQKVMDRVNQIVAPSGVKKITVNDDLTVDIVAKNKNEDIYIRTEDSTLGVQFGQCTGIFNLNMCPNLTTLVGCPKRIKGSFNYASGKNLINLEGAPEIIEGDFSCIACKTLVSLEGGPKKVKGSYSVGGCISLTSLKGAPKQVDCIAKRGSDGGAFDASETAIKSLDGCPSVITGSLYLRNCKHLKSLKGIAETITGDFRIDGSPLPDKEIQLLKQYEGNIL